MRIAIDSSSTFPPRTGVGNYTYNLIRALGKVDRETQYVLYFNWFRPSKRKPDFPYPNFRDVDNRIPARIQRLLHDKLHLPIEVFTGKIDIFHQPNYFLPPTRTAKTVVTIHDLVFWRFPETRITADVDYFKKQVPISCQRADTIIADSESTKNELVELLSVRPEKIRVVYPGVTARFGILEDTAILEAVRRRYNLSERIVLYVGTLEPRKNIGRLLEAFYVLKRGSVFKHKLVLAGKKGWLYEEIFDRVKELRLDDEVIFTGFVPDGDLPALYNLADLFVYPSLYEGFGLPVLEAMACGIPVIVSDTSSIPEIVGGAGIKLDPTDVEGWAASMESILSDQDLCQELGRRGLERAKAFSWGKTAEAVLEVYKRLSMAD